MKHFLILITAIMSVCFIACGSDDNNEPSQTERTAAYNRQAVVGKWVKKFYVSQYGKGNIDPTDHDTLTLNTDGSYRHVYEKSSIWMTGQYSVDDVYLKLEVELFTLSFSKDTMLLKDVGFGADNAINKYVRLK